MRNFKIVLNFSMASPPQLELGSSRVVAPGVCGQATALPGATPITRLRGLIAFPTFQW